MDFRHNLTAGMGKETPGLMEDNPETEMETEEDDNDDLDTQPHHQGIKRSLMISRCYTVQGPGRAGSRPFLLALTLTLRAGPPSAWPWPCRVGPGPGQGRP